MIRGPIEPAEVGLLYHHGPELFPVVELIIGPGLPVAAAIVLGRWRRIRSRLAGSTAEPAPAPADQMPPAHPRRAFRPPAGRPG